MQGGTLVAGRFRPASAPAAVSAAPLAWPDAPAGLEAAPGIDGVALSWDDPQDNTITGYEYSTDYDDKGTEDDTSDDTGTFTAIAGSDATTTSHLVTGLDGGTAYTFTLRAVNPSGADAASSVTATTVPDAPQNLAAAPRIGGVGVDMTWDGPGAGAVVTGYEVSTDGGENFVPIVGSDGSTTSHTLTVQSDGTGRVLAGSVEYTFAVRAVNESGAGAASDRVAKRTVPDAPAGLEADPGAEGVTLSWTGPGAGAVVTGYEVSTDGGENFASIADSNGSTISHLVEGLAGGTAYTFAVRAVNESGAGAASSIDKTTVPDKPTGLAATAGDAEVALSWTDPGDDTIDRYQFSTDGGETFAAIDPSNATTTTHTVTGLDNGTLYTLAVRAVNGSGAGAAASVTATPLAVPRAPANLAAAVAIGGVTLSWDSPPADTSVGAIAGYEVSTDAGDNFVAIEGSNGSTISHLVEDLDGGTAYTFAVRAVNASGKGAASSVAATTLPAAPANLGAAAAIGGVTLSWTDPGDDTIDRYQFSTDYNTADDTGTFTDIAGSDGDTVEHLVTGLDGGTAYTFAVRAATVSGAAGAASSATATTLPSAPANLRAAPGIGEVTLSWDDPGDSTINRYQVSTDGGATFADIGNGDLETADGTTSYTVGNLSGGTAYTFAVRAATASDAVGAASSATATTLPAAPENLKAAVAIGEVTLSWDDPDDGTIAKYRVSADYDPATGAGTFTDIPDSAPGGANATGYTVTGLDGGTEYTFAVRAATASGAGGATSSVDAKTLPAAPTGLEAASGADGVALSWDDPGNDTITGYEVSTDGGDTFAAIVGSGATTTEHTVTGLNDSTGYTFAVRAVSGPDPGAASSVTATTTPAAPANLQAAPGADGMALSWDNPGDGTITGYEVSTDYDSATGTGTFAAIPGSDKDTTGYTVTVRSDGNGEFLAGSTQYTFAVRAVSASGAGTEARVTATTVPAAPANLQATPGAAGMALSWTDPQDSAITRYEVSTDYDSATGTFAAIAGSTATTAGHTVTGLTNDIEYKLAVRAVNISGEGAAASVTVTPDGGRLNAPENLQAMPGHTLVTLSWDDPANDTITGYEVSTDGGATFAAIPDSAPAGTNTPAGTNANAYTVTGLANDTLYTFAVRAVNGDVKGPASTVEATPVPVPAPENLTATPEVSQVVLRWKNPENPQISSYELSTDGEESFVAIAGSGSTTTEHTVTDLDAATEQVFHLRALAFNHPGPSAVALATLKLAVQFSAATYEGGDDGKPVTVEVELSRPASDTLEIPISVTPQGRTVAEDYKIEGLADGILAFGMGERTRSFTIEATVRATEDDNFHDVKVALGFGTLPKGVVAGAPAAAVLTIVDAEGAAVRSRFSRLNAAILSKHALGIADGASRAVGRRMADAFGGRAAASFSLAGGSTVPDALRSNAQAIADGALTLEDVLAGSSFLLPLSADDGGKGGPGGAVLWGGGERQALEGTDPALAWDGAVTTGRIGIDTRLRGDLLAGLALSRSVGAFDYTDGTGPAPARGSYESRMTGVHPYLGWKSPQGLGLWGALGYGRGGIEIEDGEVRDSDPGNPVRRSDTVLKMAVLGADGPLVSGGATALALRGEASVVRVEVEGDGGLIERQTVDANRLRLALEGSYERVLASGGTLRPSLEMGLRHDGGDGAAGGGIEVGVGLGYRDPVAGLSVEGHGRVLGGQDDYRNGAPAARCASTRAPGGAGCRSAWRPSWGDTASGVDRLWDRGVAAPATGGDFPQMQMDSEIGYGYGAFGGRGLLTPYGGLSLAGGGGLTYRLGSRIGIGTRFDFDLKGERNEPAGDTAPEHSIVLRIQVRW